MKKLFFLAALFLQAGGQPVPIPIQNPSFEQGTTGWHFGPSSGVIQSGGKLVADAGYGGSFSQVLTTTPANLQEYKPGYAFDGVYVLTFSVANYFPQYPGYYTANVSYGTQELCEASGWGMAESTQITLICPSPNYLVRYRQLGGVASSGPPQGQQPLVIKFHVDGWTLLFDKVSLEFMPQ